MMHVNSNRSANFLLISISLIVAGCSDTAKTPLNINDRPAVISDTGYRQARPVDHRLETAQAYKGTVWERLLNLYALPEINSERIDRQVRWYLDRPEYLARVQRRAEPYLHHILDEIEAKNIPGELALLPVVESAFVADAYSKADASGLWQFIPATGRLFGLEQNEWYDGRRDVYASTQAATTFLKQLSETFNGDWFLALASYNYGKGNIWKAQDRNQTQSLPTDYWSLDLPRETAEYVPRLLAIARIIANAVEYNIPLHPIPNRPYFEVVDVQSQLDLNKAAELADIPLNSFLKLNPGFSRASTAPQGPHRLLIPVEKAEAFKQNLAELPFEDRVNGKQYAEAETTKAFQPEKTSYYSPKPAPVAAPEPVRYKVRTGENLASIAHKNNTTVQTLRQVNHLASTAVRPGVILHLPVEKKAKAADVPLTSTFAKSKPSGTQTYAVKKGDTFFNIARRFSVNPKDIAQWNNVAQNTVLVPGRKLTIKSTSQQQVASNSPNLRMIRYIVGKNESITQVAKKFSVSVNDIRKLNPDTQNKAIHGGQKLKILVDGQSAT